MEKEIICTLEKDGFSAHYFSGTKQPGKAVISVGASSCDEKTSIAMAGFLREAGWNVLVLGYYHWKGLPKTLCNVPLDYAERAIQWLKEEQKIGKIAMTGTSEGADYALCCAERIPDITYVIPVVPYDYVTEAVSGGTKRLHAPVYTWHGEAVPYTELTVLDQGLFSLIRQAGKAEGYGIGRMLRWVYDRQEAHLNPESRILAENMNADILLLGVKNDDCWPSDTAVFRMAAALKRCGYTFRTETYVYEKASHALMDGLDSMSALDRFELKLAFPAEKKYPRECDEARRDSFRRILKFLDGWE